MQIVKLNETSEFLINIIEKSQLLNQYKSLSELCKISEEDDFEKQFKVILDSKEQIVSTLIDIDLNEWDNCYLHIFQKLEWSELLGEKALLKLNSLFTAEKPNFNNIKTEIDNIIEKIKNFVEYLKNISKNLAPLLEENKIENNDNQQLLKVTYQKTKFIKNLEQLEKFCKIWNQIIYSFALLTHEENNEIKIYDVDSNSIVFHIGFETTRAISKAIFQSLILYQKILEIKQLQINLVKLALSRENQIKILLEEEEANIIENITEKVITELLVEYNWDDGYEVQNIYIQLQNSLKLTINFIEMGGYLDSSHFNDFKKVNEKIIEIIGSIQENNPDFNGFSI